MEEFLKNPQLFGKFSIHVTRIKSFLQAIYSNMPIENIQDGCGTTHENRMVIDGAGNLLLCHHGSRSNAVNECGSHTHISNIKNNEVYGALHWSKKKNCRSCPVITICRGACPFVLDEGHEMNCNASFYDTVSIFAYALYLLTGLRLDSIEGEHLERFPDRSDIFGLRDNAENKIVYNEKKKKVIMMKKV